jgi:hypothetical protein
MSKLDNAIKKNIQISDRIMKSLNKVIYTSVIESLMGADIRDGKILYNETNINIIQSLGQKVDRIKGPLDKLAKALFSGIKQVLDITGQDMAKYSTDAKYNSDNVLNKVKTHAATTIKTRADLSLIYGDIKQSAIALLSKPDGTDLVELRNLLKSKVVDNDLASKYFARWTHDIYFQYQRAGANELRKDIGLKFGIYQGGLIESSRDFCEERNGEVFHIDEIMEWENLDFKGKPESGYNPIIDLGGYNCRHRIDWISDELAFELKPELKEKESDGESKINNKEDVQDNNNTITKDNNITPINETIQFGFEKRFDEYVNSPNIPDFVKNAIYYLPKPSSIKSTVGKKGSYYNKGTTTLVARKDGGAQSFFHEYGHHIDMHKMANNSLLENNKGINSRSINIKESFSKDLLNIKEKYKNDTLGSIKEFLKTKDRRDYSGFSDIIDAMSNGAFFDKYKMNGHGSKYWKQDINNKYYETYANIFQILAKNDAAIIKDVKKHFPNSYNFVINDIKSIKK